MTGVSVVTGATVFVDGSVTVVISEPEPPSVVLLVLTFNTGVTGCTVVVGNGAGFSEKT